MPGIARWPGKIRAGTTSDVPVIGSDLFPTVLRMAGASTPPGRVIDGTDVLPVLTGGAAVERKVPLYWRLAMAPEPWKIAMRRDDWKILASEDLKRFELYNLKEDTRETTDLSSREAARLAAMRGELRALNAQVEAEGPDWWKRLRSNGGLPLPAESVR